MSDETPQKPQGEVTINCPLHAPIPRGNRVRVYIFIKPSIFIDSVDEDAPLLHDLDADVYYGNEWHFKDLKSRTVIDPKLQLVRWFEGHAVQAFVMYHPGKYTRIATTLTLRVDSFSEEHTELARSTSDSVTSTSARPADDSSSPIAFAYSEGSRDALSAQAPVVLPKESSTELSKESPKTKSNEPLSQRKGAPAFNFAWLSMAAALIYLAMALFNAN